MDEWGKRKKEGRKEEELMCKELELNGHERSQQRSKTENRSPN